MGTRGEIRFLLGEGSVALSSVDPNTTLLDYLRADDRCGTKEGCGEGDCGACTVVLAEAHDGGLRYRAVNACIQLLAAVDGKQVLTVEDLRARS
jgi:xanthine dehydrogenase small subunit